jgi:glutamate synthase (NADPH/NADH) large chain
LEDLALLIENIRAVNPRAKISVKIASSADCGVVGVGVAKAGSDNVYVSGAEGGTGASPSSSTESTGLPLGIGVADVHQVLIRNGLRDVVTIRADGGIKTSEDFVKLVLMGADEVTLGTALLVAGEKCVFCKGCSKYCPKNVCSPNADEAEYEERKHQTMHFLELFASHTREILASLGLHSIKEARGRVDLLENLHRGDRCDRVDLSYLLRNMDPYTVSSIAGDTEEKTERTISKPAVNAVNQEICDAVATGEKKFKRKLTIEARSFGATLAGKLATGEIKLPEGMEIETEGCTGQSFGFCMMQGMTIRHMGFANDMVCGSMSGGKIVVRLPEHLKDDPDNSIIGNSCAYGTTGGVLYANGRAGQRLGVRNSGAAIVAEGAGKYAFEYQTGGVGVLLNVEKCYEMCAGMTGGKVFAFDENKDLRGGIHKESVHIVPLDSKNELELKRILEDPASETGSKKALDILKNWKKEKASFKVILPKDTKPTSPQSWLPQATPD